MISHEQVTAMVNELDASSMAIVKDSDREFVQGVKILIDMSEPVGQRDAQRLQEIYAAFQKIMHGAMD